VRTFARARKEVNGVMKEVDQESQTLAEEASPKTRSSRSGGIHGFV
jgi:hypothetical protein